MRKSKNVYMRVHCAATGDTDSRNIYGTCFGFKHGYRYS